MKIDIELAREGNAQPNRFVMLAVAISRSLSLSLKLQPAQISIQFYKHSTLLIQQSLEENQPLIYTVEVILLA